MHADFTAFLTDEDSEATARAWAEKQGFPSAAVQAGGAEAFATRLETEVSPKCAFIDIDGHDKAAEIVAKLVRLCGPGCKLVAVGSANDVTLYRALLAAGAADYVVKPLTPQTLTGAMAQAMRGDSPSESQGKKDAKVVVFLGARGGVGTSTLAVNLGWILAHERKGATVLLDLDTQFGISALSLDLEPGHGLRDLLSSAQRVDSLMISSAIVRESDAFKILGAEEPMDESTMIDGAAVTTLVKELRPHYQTILVDLPRHLLASQKRLLSVAEEIVLVTELSLVGIRDTLRIKTLLKTLGCTARVTLVTGGIGPQRPAAVDETAFAKGAQTTVSFVMPDDPKNVVAANNAGKTLGALAPQAPLTKAIRTLADHLMGTMTAPASTKKGVLGGLWR